MAFYSSTPVNVIDFVIELDFSLSNEVTDIKILILLN